MICEPFAYQTPCPPSYRCACGASGVKLWRRYQSFASEAGLLCVDCAKADQKALAVEVDHEGHAYDPSARNGGSSDSIGWLVPAIPTEDGETFWGYTSVPHAGVCWWRALPTYALTLAESLLLHLMYYDRDRAGGLQRAGDALWKQTFERAVGRGFLRQAAHGPGVGEWRLTTPGIHAALRAKELLSR